MRPLWGTNFWAQFYLAASVLVALAATRAAPADGITAFSYSNPLDFSYDQGQTAVRNEIRDPCIIREGNTYYLVFTMWPFSNRQERHMGEPNQGGSPGIAISWRIDESKMSFSGSHRRSGAVWNRGDRPIVAGPIDHAASCFGTVGLAMGPWRSFRSDQLCE